MATSVVVRVVLFVAVAVLVAQADDYCCFPEQFVIEAEQLQGLSVSGSAVAQVNSLAMASDFTNKRVGEEIVSVTSGHAIKLKVIIDYKQNVMYTIVGQTCTKTEAPGDFQRCIPKTAHFDGSATLGEDQLTIDNFSYFENIPKILTGNISVGVTHGDCIPVRTGIIGVATQTDPPIPLVSGTGYANFKRGISDPGRWFDVPSICQQPQSGRFARRSADFDDGDVDEINNLVSLVNHIILAPFLRK